MQVSIYLDSKLLKTLDRKAKKINKSRSWLIQSILGKILLSKKEKSVFDEVFGLLDQGAASDLLQTIQTNRNESPRFI